MKDDPTFWEGATLFDIGGVPVPLFTSLHFPLQQYQDLQEGVTVVGFPTGGDNISATQGIVSRIEMQTYVHSQLELWMIELHNE